MSKCTLSRLAAPLLFSTLLLFTAPAMGDEAGDIEKALRLAEKVIFAGDSEQGSAMLAEIGVKLEQLQQSDPGNRKLVTINSKFKQLQRKVDQKTAVAAPPSTEGKEEARQKAQEIEKWRKTFWSFTTPREEKYLGAHPEMLNEARETLRQFETEAFPGGPPPELQDALKSMKNAVAHAEAEKGAASIDDLWLPRIKPLITPNDPAYLGPSGPISPKSEDIARMDESLEKGKALLREYEQAFPSGQSTHFLNQAVDKLRRAVTGYEQGRQRSTDNQVGELRDLLQRGQKVLAKNQAPAPGDSTVFVVNGSDMKEMEGKLAAIKTIPAIDPATLAGLEKDLQALKAEDSRWREKKTALDNAPRPFPAAGMTSQSLEKEMLAILKDRGIGPVEKLVIVDKDWWVQQGEFRYVKAAALQKDGEGPFFSHVTFRQMQTLSGYGPTELWEQGKKYRIAP